MVATAPSLSLLPVHDAIAVTITAVIEALQARRRPWLRTSITRSVVPTFLFYGACCCPLKWAHSRALTVCVGHAHGLSGTSSSRAVGYGTWRLHVATLAGGPWPVVDPGFRPWNGLVLSAVRPCPVPHIHSLCDLLYVEPGSLPQATTACFSFMPYGDDANNTNNPRTPVETCRL